MITKIKNFLSNTKNIITIILIAILILIGFHIVWEDSFFRILKIFIIPFIYFLLLRFFPKTNIKMLNIIFSLWFVYYYITKDLFSITMMIKINFIYTLIHLLLINIIAICFVLFALWAHTIKKLKTNKTTKIVNIVSIILIVGVIYLTFNSMARFTFETITYNVVYLIYKIFVILYLKQYSNYKIGVE